MSATLVSSSQGAAGSQEAVPAKQRPLTILFLVDQLTELGGGERILLQLAQQLPAPQFRVIVVAFREQPNPLVPTLPIDIRILPLRRTWDLQALRVARVLRRIIQREQVDIVHTFFETADTFGALTARTAGVRAIVSSRRDMGILHRLKHRLAYRLLAPMYDAVLTVSEQVREAVLRSHRIAPDKVITIYNGVRLASATASSVRARYDLPLDLPLITTVANLQRWKGVDVFLRAAALIHQARPTAHFVIAGEWSDAALTSELFALRDQLGLADCVHFLGAIDAVPALLAESTVFCLLSASEGFPNVVLEAMAAGVAVVATAVGGTPEAIEDTRSGYLVPRGDHAAAAARVVSLLDDPATRRSLAAAARRRVQRDFSAAAMLARHIEVYQRLTAPNRRSAS